MHKRGTEMIHMCMSTAGHSAQFRLTPGESSLLLGRQLSFTRSGKSVVRSAKIRAGKENVISALSLIYAIH